MLGTYEVYDTSNWPNHPGKPEAIGRPAKGFGAGLRQGLRFVIDLENGKETCQIGKVLTVLQTLGIQIALTPPVVSKNQD